MVRLVPLENDVIPMILPMNMHLIKGTWIILSCGAQSNSNGPMVQLVPLENHVIPMVLLVWGIFSLALYDSL